MASVGAFGTETQSAQREIDVICYNQHLVWSNRLLFKKFPDSEAAPIHVRGGDGQDDLMAFVVLAGHDNLN